MKKLFTIFMAVLVLCTCATADMSAKKRTSRRTSNSSSGVNLLSESYTYNEGIFHYREVLSGGRQIHDYILGINTYDYGCSPSCEAYYYDVYNDNIIYMQGEATSKNSMVLTSYDGFKLTVTYVSRDKIKVKEGTYTSTYKKIVNVDVSTFINEDVVKNAVYKLP